jgi:hypothetical protein
MPRRKQFAFNGDGSEERLQRVVLNLSSSGFPDFVCGSSDGRLLHAGVSVVIPSLHSHHFGN